MAFNLQVSLANSKGEACPFKLWIRKWGGGTAQGYVTEVDSERQPWESVMGVFTSWSGVLSIIICYVERRKRYTLMHTAHYFGSPLC